MKITVIILITLLALVIAPIAMAAEKEVDIAAMNARIEKLEKQFEQLKSAYDQVNSAYGKLKIKYNELLEKTRDMESDTPEKVVPKGVPKGC